MAFRPLYDLILLRKEEAPKTTASGLVLSTTDDPNEARYSNVVAVGEGYRTDRAVDGPSIEHNGHLVGGPRQMECIPLRVRVGDRVLFRPRSATVVKSEGQEFFLVREGELLGIEEPSEAS